MKIRIKEICEEHGISQRALAEKIGVSPVTLTNVAKGISSLEMLEKIAVALNVHVSALFEKEELAWDGATCPYCGAEIEVEFKK